MSLDRLYKCDEYRRIYANRKDAKSATTFQIYRHRTSPFLRISGYLYEKTLIKARESLINAGLIYYKSGKNKRIISSYSFVKEFKTTVTTTVNFTANQTANDTVDKGVNDTGDSTDYNKLKQKPNRNILSKVSHGDFDFISNEFLETFTLWLEYKKDRRENYKSEKSLKACYNKLVKLSKGNPAVASQIVDESIANNWAGFFELKNNKNEYGNKKQTDSTDSGDSIIRTTVL